MMTPAAAIDHGRLQKRAAPRLWNLLRIALHPRRVEICTSDLRGGYSCRVANLHSFGNVDHDRPGAAAGGDIELLVQTLRDPFTSAHQPIWFLVHGPCDATVSHSWNASLPIKCVGTCRRCRPGHDPSAHRQRRHHVGGAGPDVTMTPPGCRRSCLALAALPDPARPYQMCSDLALLEISS